MSKFFARLLETPKNETAKKAELYIYDVIDPWWGVSATQVINKLADMDLKESDILNIYLNTPGGSVSEGIAIYSILSRVKAKKITHNDSLAASMGSILFLAGEERNVAKGSFVMIHNVWTYTSGEAADLRKDADLMDKMKEGLIDIYSDRTGRDREELSNFMDEETWMSAEEAVEMGFATGITDREEETELVQRAVWENPGFNRIPDRMAALFITENKKNIVHTRKQNSNLTNNSPQSVVINQEEIIMDAKAYQEKHPEHYASIVQEGEAKGALEGAKTEQARIKSIEDLAANFSGMPTAVKSAISAYIAEAKYKSENTASVVALELLKVANEATQKHSASIADGKRAEAEIAADIPEGGDEGAAEGTDETEAAEAKARVTGMAAGIKQNRK